MVLVVNSGVLLCERGASSTYNSLLTKQAVLDTIEDPEFITHAHARRLVGGASVMHHLRNAVHWVHNRITPAKEWLKEHVNHPIANTAVKAAEALGYGMTAAGKLHNRIM